MSTYMAKPGELQPKWWLVDAQDKVVAASQASWR